MADNIGKFQKQQVLLKSIKDLMSEISLSENEQIALEQRVLDGRIKSEAVLRKQADALESQNIKFTTQEKIEKKLASTEQDIVDIGEQLQKHQKGIVDLKEEDLDATKALIKKARTQVIEQKNLGLISDDIAGHLLKEIDLREESLEATGKLAVSTQKYGGMIEDALESGKQSTDEFFGSFPGGEGLKKILGFDAAFDALKNGAKAAMGAVVQSLLAGQGPMAALKAGQAAFNATAMMNPYVAIAAAILIVIGLIYQQNKAIKEQAKAQGVSVAQAKQQILLARQAGQQSNIQLATSKDILATQNKINDAMGASIAINAKNAAQVAEVGMAFGMGAEAAADTAGALMQVGASQEEVANIMKEGNLAAAQAGVDMGKVQKDIAENAGKMNKYFAGSPKLLQKAAIEAQKIGMSLESMAKMSEGLLDIESSLQAQFEFQAFTGKQINLDKARQLALEGDIAGASKEVMKNIGDINDFENMSMKQREKLAKMTGMELGDLEKSLRIQSLRGKMTDEELAQAQGLNLSAAELKDMDADQLATKLKSQQATDKMAKQFSKMKDTLMMALQPIMDMVSIIMDILAPVFQLLGVFQKIGAVVMNVLLAPFKMISGILDGFMDALQPIFDIFNDLGDQLGGEGGLGAMFKKIGDIIGKVIFLPLKMIIKVLAAVLTPVIEFIASVFTGIGDIIQWIGDSIQKYLIDPMDAAIEALGKLNPLNWFGGDDEAEVSVTTTADGEPLEAAGSIEDGVIQSGKIISTDPADTITATKEGGGFMSKLGDMASKAYSMSPMGMATNALGITGEGGLFGGGEGKDEQVEILKQILLAVQTPPPVVVGDEQVAAIGNKVSARKSMMG